MKRIIIKTISCILGGATLFNTVPIKANGSYSKPNNGGLSTTSKIVIGLGVGALALLGGGTLVYKLCCDGEGSTSNDNGSDVPQNGSGTNSGNSTGNQTHTVTNANLTNTENLCYWHSFIQQMYSLRAFRKFINEVNTVGMAQNTAAKVLAFREFFNQMRNKHVISLDDCSKFAHKLIPAGEIGRQNDIHEILVQFIGDVKNIYDTFCREKYHTADSNIFGSVLKLERSNFGLQDLVILQEGCAEEMRDAVLILLGDDQQRRHIYREYLSEHCGIVDVPPTVEASAATDPEGEFAFVFDKKFENGLSAAQKESLVEFRKAINGTISDQFLNYIFNSNYVSQIPCVKEVINQVYRGKQINVPVVEDQFVLFVNRNLAPGIKNTQPVEFGNGVVNYKGTDYGLTAVSVHGGDISDRGHYYTYKMESDGNWYCYDDTKGSVHSVSWDDVKRDAQTNCTMFTFTRLDKILGT